MSCKSYVEISNICKNRLPVFSMYLLKQLNVECNVNFSCLAVLQINNALKALACRATWRVKKTHVQEARNLIASTSLSLDDSISQVRGVQFFVSSITATSTNAKKTRQGADENSTSDQCTRQLHTLVCIAKRTHAMRNLFTHCFTTKIPKLTYNRLQQGRVHRWRALLGNSFRS